MNGVTYNTTMGVPLAVLDTNVLVAGLCSRSGASHRLLELMGTGRFEIAISVPLVLEYEDTLLRQAETIGLEATDVTTVIDYVCSIGRRQDIYFLWRPLLRDPKDELVLELAVAANCDGIITFNTRAFAGADRFGLWLMTPRQFLTHIGETR